MRWRSEADGRGARQNVARQRLALYERRQGLRTATSSTAGRRRSVLPETASHQRTRREDAEMIDEGLTAAAARSPDTDQPPTILADLLNATSLPKQDEEAFIGDAKDKEIRDLRRQIAELTKSVPAPPPSAPPKPGPADPNSWIFQLGVSPKKEEEEPEARRGRGDPRRRGRARRHLLVRGRSHDLIIFEEGERQGYEGGGLAGIRVGALSLTPPSARPRQIARRPTLQHEGQERDATGHVELQRREGNREVPKTSPSAKIRDSMFSRSREADPQIRRNLPLGSVVLICSVTIDDSASRAASGGS